MKLVLLSQVQQQEGGNCPLKVLEQPSPTPPKKGEKKRKEV